MPNNGLIFQTAAIEWKLESTATAIGGGSGTLAKSHTANASTQYVPNAINVNTGIYLEVSSSDDGAGTVAWQAKYDGPGAPFGGYIVGAAAYLSTVSITVRATGVKIYCKLTGSLFRTVWNSLMVFVNGTLQTTLTGVDVTSNGVGPNYIDYIGTPLYATGSCSASKIYTPSTYDPCDPAAMEYVVEAEANQTITAGWRFQDESNNWTVLPCAVWTASIPTSGSCPYNLSFGSEVQVADTNSIIISTRSYQKTERTYDGRRNQYYNVTVECCDIDGNCTVEYDSTDILKCIDPCNPTGPLIDGYVDAYYTENWTESHGGAARAIPNLERAIVRFNSDYKALWRRFDFPEVRGSATRTCTNGAVSVNTGGATTVYNDLGPDFLEVVTNATSNVEQAFPNTIYTQANWSKGKTYTKTWAFEAPMTGCVCGFPEGFTCPEGTIGVVTCTLIPITEPNTNQAESIAITFPSFVDTLAGYQGHADMLMRYTGSWVNPHWNLAYHRDDWDVDGASQPWQDYWGPIKEQWLYNAALPSNPRTRNSQISSPLEIDNGNQPFLDAFFGGFRWIGISRFKLLSMTQPSSITLSTSRPGVWATNNCSISLGASNITVSAFSGSDTWVEVDLAQWTADPFMLLTKASRVQVGWNMTNVKNIDVAFIGADNASNYIANAAGTYDLPTGIQLKYSGTWAIDNGYSIISGISDTGTDERTDGVSATYMANPERVVGFQLGKGRQYGKLRFRITPTNPANSVTINWPIFTLESTHPLVYHENSRAASMLWADGPNHRYGNLTWYSPILGFQDPPLVTGMGTPNTVIDALAFKYRVVNGNGGASLASTITTDLSSLYDAYEGQSIAVVDKFSTSYVLPKGTNEDLRIALINSFSEIPPLACFPFRKRSLVDWTATGSYCQVVYDHVQDGRYLISNAAAAAKLQTPASVDSGSAVAVPPSGWYIWRFNPVLDNTEVDWRIVSNSELYAKVRPWHGWFSLLRSAACKTSLDIDFASNVHGAAFVDSGGNVLVRKADNQLAFATVDTLALAATSAVMRIDRQSTDQKIYIVAEINKSIKLYKSNQLGEGFTLMRTIANGVKPAFVIGRDGNRYIYWIDGTAIKGQITDRADTVLQASVTAVASGVDDECIAVDEDVTNGGNRRLVLIDVESGSLTQRTSDDGITFS